MLFKYLFLLLLIFLVKHHNVTADEQMLALAVVRNVITLPHGNGNLAFKNFTSNINFILDKIVCYHGSWSAKRTNLGRFSLETDMDPSLCTHLIYAFCGVQQTGELKVNDPHLDLDDNKGLGNYKKFNNLKQKNPSLKTLISVGGWKGGSLNFSIVAADPMKRATFLKSSIELLQNYNFNGLDIDWEYPDERHGLKNNDRENFAVWLKELREGFKPLGFLLTAAVKAVGYGAFNTYNISELAKQVDFLNIMSYALSGPWSKGVGIHSPLYAGPADQDERAKQRNFDAIAQFWIKQGTPRYKIVMGIPFYGRSFTLTNSQNHSVGAAHNGSGIGGPYTRQPGIVVYNELCEMFKSNDSPWHLEWESKQMVPYAYRDNQWIGYENERSVALKADYVKKYNLGGVSIWAVNYDDFRGVCGAKPYPLMRVINDRLHGVTNKSAKNNVQRSFRIYPIYALILVILYHFLL